MQRNCLQHLLIFNSVQQKSETQCTIGVFKDTLGFFKTTFEGLCAQAEMSCLFTDLRVMLS